MIITEKTEKLLEFDKIKQMLAERAATEGSKRAALALMPEDDPDRVEALLRRTTDASMLLRDKGMPPFGGVRDISEAIDRAEKGAMLSASELLDAANLLRTVRGLAAYGKTERRYETVLDDIFSRLLPDRPLEDRIFSSIISEDRVADDASPALSDIRRKIRLITVRIRELLAKYTGGDYSKYLQESIVTMRNGRYVVPVKVEYKNEIKGLVHDTSSSGATYFIEPMAVVEANNELHTYEAKERYEVESVMRQLSACVADAAAKLRYDLENTDELALVFACASFSSSYEGRAPVILKKERTLEFYGARHPLIPAATVVPVNIKLGGEADTLIITGPNTGGKTVSLKTLGLFAAMAQSGLHIPVAEGSRMCVFDRILVDLGDDQSIEHSLSTFSAHMVNIVSIVNDLTPDSLVLFDELGVGTDPIEGAALAIAIIGEVRSAGALCAATTHYAELKSYALCTPGVQNASCEFDVDSLRPTYRLIIGAPGRSCALAISERLGLPKRILDRASGEISDENRRFEDVIERLETDREAYEKAKSEAEELLEESRRAKLESERRASEKLAAAERELERARKKATEMIEGARISSEYVFAELEKAKKAKDRENFGAELEAARKAVRARAEADGGLFDSGLAEADPDYVLPRELHKGDRVWLMNIGKEGVLLSDPDRNGGVRVSVGGIRTKTVLSNLKLAEDVVTVTDPSDGKKVTAKEYTAAAVSKKCPPELDIRGMTADEGWTETDRYLDSAVFAGLRSVTVIHGKGTGALRAAIRGRLSSDPRVSSFRAGQYGEGDTGVTVVELK